MDLGRDSSHRGVRQSVELLYNSGFDGDESQRSGLEDKVASECNDMDVVNASRKSLPVNEVSRRSLPVTEVSRKSIPASELVRKNSIEAEHVQIEVTESHHSASSSADPIGGSDLLDAIPASQRTSVVFTDIQAWVPLAFKAPGLAKQLKDKVVKPSDAKLEAARKQILFHISASCSPGELLALMGPSGSGKTSLLSVLGDRKPKLMTMSGSVLFNGQPMTRQVKRRMGFVLQDDLLHETLTVHETLRYIALLRLPQSMSIDEKESRAEGVMKVLGISKQRDTLVGGRMHKGVSGGERKRVSVGAELLINPSVLFLDEPTSGLDASTALQLVETLRQLASGGRSIITTIHQPSSRLYATMDSLILLAQGHTIYFGKAGLADRWFSHLGYPNPGNFNIADYVLDLASNTIPVPKKYKDLAPPDASGALPNNTSLEWDTIGYLTRTAEGFLAKHQEHGFTDARQLSQVQLPGESAHDLIPSVRQSSELVDVPLDNGHAKDGGAEGGPKVQKFGASWVRQFFVLFERSIRSRRLDALNFEKFIQVFLVGLLASLFWWQAGQRSTIVGMTDFVGVLFFILVFPTFGAVFTAIFTFPTEYAMLCKERGSGMYQLSSYYLARTTADLPLVILMPSIFFNEVYWMAGFSYNAANYFFTYFTVFLMVIVGDSAGLWLGAMAMDARRAQTFVTVFMLSQFLVAGFFVRNIPSWISWAKYLSFLYWGYSLMNKIQLPAVDVTGCTDPGVKCSLEDLQRTLRTPRSLTETKALDVFVIIAFLIFFRAFTFVVLKRRTSK